MQKTKSVILAVLAVGITFYALWFQNRPVVVKKATHEDVIAEAKKGGYRLLDTGQLWELYQKKSDDVLIVDTRQEWEYRTGHIKGAANFPMEPTWWSRWRKKGIMATFLGPDKKRAIVFY
jgi:predicted sulfurtransferase